MRRSLIIAVAILATMTVALVALAVEPFVDGDTITDLPSDQATDQAPSDAAIADAPSQDAAVAFVGAADWPPQVVDLLLVVGTAAFDIEALPDDIRVLVTEILDDGRDTLTFAELDALLDYAADHPELFESDMDTPSGSTGDGTSDGSSDSDQGGDQPQD